MVSSASMWDSLQTFAGPNPLWCRVKYYGQAIYSRSNAKKHDRSKMCVRHLDSSCLSSGDLNIRLYASIPKTCWYVIFNGSTSAYKTPRRFPLILQPTLEIPHWQKRTLSRRKKWFTTVILALMFTRNIINRVAVAPMTVHGTTPCITWTMHSTISGARFARLCASHAQGRKPATLVDTGHSSRA